MGTTLNRKGYEKLITEDLDWLMMQPRSLERDHIIDVLKASVDLLYDPQQKDSAGKKECGHPRMMMDEMTGAAGCPDCGFCRR